jgi:hypothetical protein
MVPLDNFPNTDAICAWAAATQNAGGFQIPRACMIAICFSITSRL